jgi:DNA-binding CsgD family transcriptional regulator
VTEPLTIREAQCVEAVRRHGSNRQAAGSLGISKRTLEAHLQSARDKRGVHRTWQLFAAA